MDSIWSDHVFCDPANLCLLIGASDPFTLNSSEDRIFICHSLPIFMSYIFLHFSISITGFPWWLSHKEPACQCRRCGLVGSLGCEDPLEKEMASHSSIPAWEIPWTDKPGELQSMCHERVGHDLATKQLPNYCVKYFQVNCFILLSFLSIFFPPSSSLLSFRNFHHVYVDKLVDVSQVFEPVFIIFFLFIHYSFSFLLHRLDRLSLCPDS